jgi:hypothetical protein
MKCCTPPFLLEGWDLPALGKAHEKGGRGMSESESERERKDKLSMLLLTKLKGLKHQVTWSHRSN